MSTAKQDVQKLLEQLPDKTTLEEIQYHLYVRQKIERGLDDLQAGRVISEEEADKRMPQWLDDDAAGHACDAGNAESVE